MAHRDTHIALYGLVAGIILGGSSLAYVATPVQASVSPTITNNAKATDYARRAIDRKGIQLRSESETHSYPTVKSSAASSSLSFIKMPSTTCDAVIGAVEKIWNVYHAVVPVTIKNSDMRAKMDAAFTDALSTCTQKASASSAAEGALSSSAAVDNHCEKFSKFSVRYTQCVIAEQYGKTYP